MPCKREIIYYPFVGQELNDEPFDLSKGNYSWTQQLKILADQHNIAIHTPDKATYKNVLSVLFFDNLFYRNINDISELQKKDLLKKTIYIDYEPPTGHAKKHEAKSMRQFAKIFKNVVTYDDDLAGESNFIKGNVANYYAAPIKVQVPYKKKKMVCMITNNVTSHIIIDMLNYWNTTNYYNNRNIKKHTNSAYHLRAEIAKYFLYNHPEDLDLYGSHWPKMFSKINKSLIPRQDKIQKISEYKFAITFDSYINQRGYISEKIFDVFASGAIPIYLGATNVSDYIPRDCYIDMRDYSSYNHLYTYLSNLEEREYQFRIEQIKKYLKSPQYRMHFSSEAIANTLFNISLSPNSSEYNYNYKAADKVLRALKSEQKRIIPKTPGLVVLDKQQKNGKWCFICAIFGSKDDGSQVFYQNNGKFTKLSIHEEVDGKQFTLLKPKMATFDIPYEDIINNQCITYHVSINGHLKKMKFFENKLINATRLDESHTFKSCDNKVYIESINRR